MNSEPRLEMRKPPTRAKWRSSSSACLSALKKCLTLPTLLEMGMLRQLRDFPNCIGNNRIGKVVESDEWETKVLRNNYSRRVKASVARDRSGRAAQKKASCELSVPKSSASSGGDLREGPVAMGHLSAPSSRMR
jgi:hypothetical protein